MNSPQLTPETASPAAPVEDFKTILTWRNAEATRIEQARVQVTGDRVKAYGQIIAAATPTSEAFCATYDLLTNDLGVTRRLSVQLVRAGGEVQISLTRDAEQTWLIQTPQGTTRGDFGGARDVDLMLSPMFNTLPIRRLGLHRTATTVELPVVYLRLPEGVVSAETQTYTAGGDAIEIVSPVGNATIHTDEHGFVSSYSGLAERI
ncbi:putative glycolipid-binding domain-containing protein [Williamsia sp. CHRR-6]|uniref:putative glycolipid-binding domain-containing protein n=1 Tax=Williamsia sp. CHRR-6 TaxID=2835871 RepID=UPI0027DE03E5|nr:putative glycolipid-binding domain-containing protein [Williamsia sp. CHRR-6]